jgi:hypothetical protein
MTRTFQAAWSTYLRPCRVLARPVASEGTTGCFNLRIVAQSTRSTRTIRTLLDRRSSLPKNHLRILRNEGESLIQIFDAIRDWALLRYHPVKAVNIEKTPELGREWRDGNPRMVGESAENLKGHE